MIERGNQAALPLSGIRILDLSRILAGPFCSMILGDLGAEVIKVEKPDAGDDTRSWGPPFLEGESAYFLSVNRNKKSVTIDLSKQKGREISYKLARKCDVLLENFSPGVTKRLGVDYEKVHQVNPRLVYCSISGFGQTGPYKDNPAYDLVIQGMGGLMGITGDADGPPVRIGVAITDIGAGMYAAIAILAALKARERTGQGQWIDVSILDTAVSWMTYMAANYFATGRIPERIGSAHPSIVPYQCFKTSDEKYITIAVGNDDLWRNFCKALGLGKVAEDPRFATNPQRVKNRKELIPLLDKILSSKPSRQWIELLMKERVPSGPLYTMHELFVDPQLLHRKMLQEIEHPRAGKIKQIGNPIKFSGRPGKIRAAPPMLSQHTAEILVDLLSLSERDIQRLKEEQVI